VDGATNRYWGATAVGDWAQFEFAQPFRLLGVAIHTGASTDPAEFAAQGRPTSLDLVVSTSDGKTTTLPIDLADKPGSQSTDTGISDVTTIRIVIRGCGNGRWQGHRVRRDRVLQTSVDPTFRVTQKCDAVTLLAVVAGSIALQALNVLRLAGKRHKSNGGRCRTSTMKCGSSRLTPSAICWPDTVDPLI
jgi:hypothetical protein